MLGYLKYLKRGEAFDEKININFFSIIGFIHKYENFEGRAYTLDPSLLLFIYRKGV